MAAGVVFLIGVFLLVEAAPVLARVGIWRFFSDGSWYPTRGFFDLRPMIAGTALATAGAVAVATPLALLVAVFCRFYAPRPVARLTRRVIELLAGVPSVVYGFWGLVVLVPIIGRLRPPGPSLLAGLSILALMILPTIALMADVALAGVPRSHRLGCAALGLSRWAMLRNVVLPEAGPGLLTAVLLGTGRALGETMAVVMVCGNVVQVPPHLLAPMRTLTANIALEMAYAAGDHRGALFVSGLVLAGMVTLLVVAAGAFETRRIQTDA